MWTRFASNVITKRWSVSCCGGRALVRDGPYGLSPAFGAQLYWFLFWMSEVDSARLNTAT
jgi:hypothetical protein